MRAYRFLNGLFHGLHGVVIGFTALGWLVPALRPAHLVLVLLTLMCWFILGLRLGIGYCPLTDWHWRLKAAHAEGRPTCGYIPFVATRIGFRLRTSTIDRLVLLVTLAVGAASTTLNVRAWTH